jgi:hypothetical protein
VFCPIDELIRTGFRLALSAFSIDAPSVSPLAIALTGADAATLQSAGGRRATA